MLPISKLHKLSDSANPTTAETASKLYHTAEANPLTPVLDDKRLVERVGVKAAHYIVSVYLHGKKRRVTVSWCVRAGNSDTALKFTIITPSRVEVKRSKQKTWLLNNESGAKRIEDELVRSGYSYRGWWLEMNH